MPSNLVRRPHIEPILAATTRAGLRLVGELGEIVERISPCGPINKEDAETTHKIGGWRDEPVGVAPAGLPERTRSPILDNG
jgi:hypothetical protein